ncbi:MAG TPA: SUKH-3 domain-containing protein [Thermohalobaculum sp.]|nr:SUKH-3 domain-containing protein [Thermohalobaculum sp.]
MEPPVSVRAEFEAAGWFAGRRVDVDHRVPPDHPAFPVLASFGGLTVGKVGPGRECAASDIRFEYTPPSISVANEMPELGCLRLIPVGLVHHQHGELAIDRIGRTFHFSIVHDAMSFGGDSWQEAVERLLLGLRDQPMLLPGQSEVTLYGGVYGEGHPDLYRLDLA